MKQVQYLRAAQKYVMAHTIRRLAHPITSMAIGYLQQSDLKNLKALSDTELTTIKRHTLAQLTKERRRCNARHATYNFNRHIQLYSLHKALEQLIGSIASCGPQ